MASELGFTVNLIISAISEEYSVEGRINAPADAT